MWQKMVLGDCRTEQKCWEGWATAYKDTVAEKLLVKLYTFDITKFDSPEGHEMW